MCGKPSAEMAERLMEAAMRAADNAYAPYSNFPVGAAVLTGRHDRDRLQCRKRELSPDELCRAGRDRGGRGGGNAHYKGGRGLLVPGRNGHACGACRQVINEFKPVGEELLDDLQYCRWSGARALFRHSAARLWPARSGLFEQIRKQTIVSEIAGSPEVGTNGCFHRPRPRPRPRPRIATAPLRRLRRRVAPILAVRTARGETSRGWRRWRQPNRWWDRPRVACRPRRNGKTR